MDEDTKVRENRLRRIADRQGYRLIKSRSRDTQAVDFGLYAVIDVETKGAVNPAIAGRWVCSWDLDDVEEYLTQERDVIPPVIDWEAEQKKLADEREAAHQERLRLHPRGPIASGESLGEFSRAVDRSEEASRRFHNFLRKRLRDDPSWGQN